MKIIPPTFRDTNILSNPFEPVPNNCPLALEVIQRDMVVAVDYPNLFECSTQYLNRLNSLFVFRKTWSWSVIREQKPIQNKVAIVGVITKVSTIAIIFFTITSLRLQSLAIVSSGDGNG